MARSTFASALALALYAPADAWNVPAPVALRSRNYLPSMPKVQMQMQTDYLMSPPRLPKVAIEYCTRCNWMLRAAWYSQELLTTFNGTLAAVELRPNDAVGGIFEVTLCTSAGEEVIWDRKGEGGFPEAKELKQIVRDVIEPRRDLGHSDADGVSDEGSTGDGFFSRVLAMIKGDRAARGETR